MECERNYLLVGEKDEVNKKQKKKSDLKNILQKFGKKSSLRITFMVVTATVCLFFFLRSSYWLLMRFSVTLSGV